VDEDAAQATFQYSKVAIFIGPLQGVIQEAGGPFLDFGISRLKFKSTSALWLAGAERG